MSNIIVAIDPGESGGMAWRVDGEDHVQYMPDTPKGIIELLRSIYGGRESEAVCYLEDVGKGMPGQSSSATAKFARHNGHLEMALIADNIKVVKVLPQKWQKTFSLGKSSDYEKTEWKRRLKQRSEELFPQFKVTLKNADALLILEYAKSIEC